MTQGTSSAPQNRHNLRHLRAFLAVADTHSASRAGEICNVSFCAAVDKTPLIRKSLQQSQVALTLVTKMIVVSGIFAPSLISKSTRYSG
ncbi:LysR family transcriptional regulator [Rhizobium sp. Root708]|uniref:LysR family transcriptional regulator n=1 Tax=Rhizobium sp. Root708 TaxID=1736592 RepID=UPI00138F61A4|nr:LysR family transcriptional regulator [Rhizobium sp. Root708]